MSKGWAQRGGEKSYWGRLSSTWGKGSLFSVQNSLATLSSDNNLKTSWKTEICMIWWPPYLFQEVFRQYHDSISRLCCSTQFSEWLSLPHGSLKVDSWRWRSGSTMLHLLVPGSPGSPGSSPSCSSFNQAPWLWPGKQWRMAQVLGCLNPHEKPGRAPDSWFWAVSSNHWGHLGSEPVYDKSLSQLAL